MSGRATRPSRSRIASRVLFIAEGTISATGCVLSLAVLRSVHPLLDMEAIRAISAWRFTPTLLGGEPVPVIMTVTVNFKLE
jgi:protein TonB